MRSIRTTLVTAALTAALLITGSTATQAATTAEARATYSNAGDDRYVTSLIVRYMSFPRADTVILATGDRLVDAVSAGPLASRLGAPISLRYPSGQGDDQVWEAINREDVTRVLIVGGPTAVPTRYDTNIQATGRQVTRLSGATRYETAAAVADFIATDRAFEVPTAALVTSGQDAHLADAVASGGIGGHLSMPVLLADPGHGDQVDAFLAAHPGAEITVVGGTLPDSMTDAWHATVVAGATRYDTSLRLADWAASRGVPTAEIVTAAGVGLPDALLGAVYGDITLLVPTESLGAPVTAWMDRHDVRTVQAVGGRTPLH